MTTKTDLFPETLIVNLVNGQPMTGSLQIAEHFGKHHRAVLKAIRDVTERPQNAGRLHNFVQSSYINQQGKEQPMYLLTRSGFQFTAMGFTGAEADQWKWAFIDAFDAMESELRAKEARFANALDQIRPCLRPVVEGTELGESRAVIAKTLGRSAASVSYHRSRARHLGLLPLANSSAHTA
jgi:Rha family phage regulatory protein